MQSSQAESLVQNISLKPCCIPLLLTTSIFLLRLEPSPSKAYQIFIGETKDICHVLYREHTCIHGKLKADCKPLV
jgi:hypothetical protein